MTKRCSLATYWAEDRIQFVFALRSFLIKPRSTFQNCFTITLLPGSPALLQTRECSEYHLYAQSPVVSLLSLTRLQLSGPTPCFSPSFYLCQFFQIFLENIFSKTILLKHFLQSSCPEIRTLGCIRAYDVHWIFAVKLCKIKEFVSNLPVQVRRSKSN